MNRPSRQNDGALPSAQVKQSSAHPLRGRTARRFVYPVTALRYPDAGHLAGGLTVYLHSVTDNALTTSGGTQAAPADAHVWLIGRVSSAWWWPGMKLRSNGRCCCLERWSRYRCGDSSIIEAAAHMRVWMLDPRHWIVERRPQAGDAEVGDD